VDSEVCERSTIIPIRFISATIVRPVALSPVVCRSPDADAAHKVSSFWVRVM